MIEITEKENCRYSVSRKPKWRKCQLLIWVICYNKANTAMKFALSLTTAYIHPNVGSKIIVIFFRPICRLALKMTASFR